MTIADLITRVESGSGSDRQLDADICVALQWGLDIADGVIRRDDCYHECIANGPSADPIWRIAPHLTSSLDAIRALFKERLEDFEHSLSDANGAGRAFIWSALHAAYISEANLDIHRAFLSAVLKAIAAKEG